MSETTHTKGPWHVKSEFVGPLLVVDSQRVVVAKAGHDSTREAIANAELIAAAPELLEALKKAEQMIHSEYCGTSHNPFCEELQQLIAKAEGRS